jgi:hypothetical protein
MLGKINIERSRLSVRSLTQPKEKLKMVWNGIQDGGLLTVAIVTRDLLNLTAPPPTGIGAVIFV